MTATPSRGIYDKPYKHYSIGELINRFENDTNMTVGIFNVLFTESPIDYLETELVIDEISEPISKGGYIRNITVSTGETYQHDFLPKYSKPDDVNQTDTMGNNNGAGRQSALPEEEWWDEAVYLTVDNAVLTWGEE